MIIFQHKEHFSCTQIEFDSMSLTSPAAVLGVEELDALEAMRQATDTQDEQHLDTTEF